MTSLDQYVKSSNQLERYARNAISGLVRMKKHKHFYNHVRLIGFPKHDYFQNYCACGARQPNDYVWSKEERERLKKEGTVRE